MNKTLTKYSGSLLAISGVIVFLGIQLAEINYVGDYSTRSNYISDLGVNNSAASLIFNFSMITAGVLILLANRGFQKKEYSKALTYPLMAYGLGTLLIGVFPSSIPPGHVVAATLVFLFGPIVAFGSRKHTRGVIRKLVTILGCISVVFLIGFLVATSTNTGIDTIGGTERFLIYPITMWLVLFGSYRAGINSTKELSNKS